MTNLKKLNDIVNSAEINAQAAISKEKEELEKANDAKEEAAIAQQYEQTNAVIIEEKEALMSILNAQLKQATTELDNTETDDDTIFLALLDKVNKATQKVSLLANQLQIAVKDKTEARISAQKAQKKAQEANKKVKEAHKKVEEANIVVTEAKEKRAAEEAAVKKVQEDAAKKAAEDAAKKAAEAAASQKAAEEAASQKAAEEAAAQKAAEEAASQKAAQKAADEAAVKKAQEDAAKKAQEEADKKAQEEADKKAQEEADKKAAAAQKAADEAAAQKAAEEAADEAAKKNITDESMLNLVNSSDMGNGAEEVADYIYNMLTNKLDINMEGLLKIKNSTNTHKVTVAGGSASHSTHRGGSASHSTHRGGSASTSSGISNFTKLVNNLFKINHIFNTHVFIQLMTLISYKTYFDNFWEKFNKDVTKIKFINLFFIDLSKTQNIINILKKIYPNLDSEIYRDTLIYKQYEEKENIEITHLLFIGNIIDKLYKYIKIDSKYIESFFANKTDAAELAIIIFAIMFKINQLFIKNNKTQYDILWQQKIVIQLEYENLFKTNNIVDTFIQIRVDNEDLNPRFDYSICNDNNLIVKYYNFNEKINSDADKALYITNANKQTYIFGPFSNIFKPNSNHVSNLDNMTDKLYQSLEHKLKNQYSILVIGYGSSGSGKSSSLIYLETQDKDNKVIKTPGILERFSNKLSTNFNYTKLIVNIFDFYVNFNDEKSVIIKPITIDKKDIFEFINKDNTWNLNSIDKNDGPELISLDFTWKIESIGLGDFIFRMFKLREIEPTSNNIESSRSHILVFLTFSNENDEKKTQKICIGDFAGVENTFNCSELLKPFYDAYTHSIKYKDKHIPLDEANGVNNEEFISINKMYTELKCENKKISSFSTKLSLDDELVSLTTNIKNINKDDDIFHNIYQFIYETLSSLASLIDTNPRKFKEDLHKKIKDKYKTSLEQWRFINVFNDKYIDKLTSGIKLTTHDGIVGLLLDNKKTTFRKLIKEYREGGYNNNPYSLADDLKTKNNEKICELLTLKKINYNCNLRNKEGIMINNTLREIRVDIGDIVKSIVSINRDTANKEHLRNIAKKIYPTLSDDKLNAYLNNTLPLIFDNNIHPYCRNKNGQYINPYSNFKPNLNKTTTNYTSVMIQQIVKQGFELSKLHIVVFTVVNLSNKDKKGDPVNNPPPIPFISINNLKLAELSKNFKIIKDEIKLLYDTLSKYDFYNNKYDKKKVDDMNNDLLLITASQLYDMITNTNDATSLGTIYATDRLRNLVDHPFACRVNNNNIPYTDLFDDKINLVRHYSHIDYRCIKTQSGGLHNKYLKYKNKYLALKEKLKNRY